MHKIMLFYCEKFLFLINYVFNKGKIYVIIGKNGTGKTTLMYSILGMFDGKYRGDILFNNENILDVDMEYMRKNVIGYSEQLPVIFNGTVFDNIFLYGNKSKKSIMYNKLKLTKRLSHNGKNISGGEKLKISIERVFVKNSSIIIWDEPSSMLDSASVTELANILQDIKKDKIIIIVTHDKKIINIADKVIDCDSHKSNKVW